MILVTVLLASPRTLIEPQVTLSERTKLRVVTIHHSITVNALSQKLFSSWARASESQITFVSRKEAKVLLKG
ncbi:hypothetical protein HYALB_00012603 [Hymenoscyphus albidus]|uniref:Uncharacterized protein n=1 Tax=Hymenoscyphus albidus TaxID=595503 RepID=A0A9N9Q900_9HELO|nr:hypothetical protein HYALB_00012603 [Hymenoscyphus albidus]